MENMTQAIEKALKERGISARRASLEAAGTPELIRMMRRGHVPSVTRMRALCDTLGLEFYIGPPRWGGDSEDREKAILDKRETEELEVMRKAEALRAEIASMAARLEAVTSPNVDTTRRIRQSELVIPTLILLATQSDGLATTCEIIFHLEDWFKPSGEDAETLRGRKDSRFSQIVRNMISHRKDAGSFIRNGYADYLSDLQGLRITEKGRKLLQELVNEG